MAKKRRRNSNSSTTTRRHQLAQRAGQHFHGKRDLYEVMGYPRVLHPEDYADIYKRQDLAPRIIDAYADATWREEPEIKGDELFTKSFKSLKDKHNLYRVFHRLDRLMQLGHYGVLVLGLAGGEPLHQPVSGSGYRLLYLQPHSERTAEVIRWNDDPRSPRFGKPEMYRVTSGINWTGAGAGQRQFNVHHSRVIHVAERALEDEAIGLPRLERVFNRLMDTDKLLGGSAEMYWQNVAMILAFIAEANATWAPGEKEDMANQIEEMQHGLRRALRLKGVNPEQLAPGLQGADPGEHLDKQLDFIAGASGVPKRILIGSERGELSSEQDENNWMGRIAERREQWAVPSLLDVFMSRGVQLGFLQGTPEEASWDRGDSYGEKDRAEIARVKAAAVKEYLSAMGAETVIPRETFLRWLGEDPDDIMPEEEPPELDEQDPDIVAMWRHRRG